MMCILTDMDEEGNNDEVQTVSRNGRADVVEAICDMDEKYDVVAFAETGSRDYSTARAGSDDETVE